MTLDNLIDATVIAAACAVGCLALREIRRFLGPVRRPRVRCVVRKVWDSNDNNEEA